MFLQANKAKFQAKSAARDAGLPVSAPALYDYGTLQTDVGFLGFGKKTASKVCASPLRGVEFNTRFSYT